MGSIVNMFGSNKDKATMEESDSIDNDLTVAYVAEGIKKVLSTVHYSI
jgi:hypothetical protein